MSAPLFLVEPGALASAEPGGEYVLDGPEGRHAATVRRLGPGERADVADGQGRVARCTVARVRKAQAREPARLVLAIAEVVELPEPTPRFVLVQALAKGDRDDLAVEAATELGVDEVVPWQAERSVVVWRGERAAKSLRRWHQIVRAASKQSRRPRVPVVGDLVDGAGLCARVRSATLTVVLHEGGTQPLAAVQVPAEGEVVLVVGPEGGISPAELDALVGAGATVSRIGREVLRSSTAGPAALSVLSAITRWR